VGRYYAGPAARKVRALARQSDLDRFVALKELAAFHAADHAFAQRFLRESRVAVSLSHPNIVIVHDYFEHDSSTYMGPEQAMAQEMVRGLTSIRSDASPSTCRRRRSPPTSSPRACPRSSPSRAGRAGIPRSILS
jgi:serine/threonine protein kinase